MVRFVRAVEFAIAVAVVLTFVALGVFAQTQSGLEQGTKPYGSFQGGDIDSINMANGNLSLHIPLISYPQRGGQLNLSFSVQYTNPTFQPHAACLAKNLACSSAYYSVIGGVGIVSDFTRSYSPVMGSGGLVKYYQVGEPDGSIHQLAEVGSYPYNWMSKDATGYLFSPGPLNQSYQYALTGDLWDRHGLRYSMASPSQPSSITDVNGNQMTANLDSDGYAVAWNDTLGRVIPTSASQTSDFTGCTGPYPIAAAYLWTLPGISGGTTQFKKCFAMVPLSFTVPGCVGVCKATNYAQPELQSIVLPNNTTWIFAYDNTGSLSQITLPTGGTISYTYDYTAGLCVGPQLIVNTVQTEYYPYGRAVTSRTVNANDGTGPNT